MSIYTVPSDSVDDIWTKKGLIAVRNFETKALADENYKKTCISDSALGGSAEVVACNHAKSLFTPLSMFPDKNNIENMTEA